MTSPQLVGQEQSLSTLIQMRQWTDVEVPATWLLLPLTSYLVWAVFAVVWWTGGLGLGRIKLGPLGVINLTLPGILGLIGILGLAASVGSSFLLYILVNRINSHSARTEALLTKTLGALESRISSPGSPALFPLNSAEGNLLSLARGKRERSAALWALLAMIPFIGWIFLIGALWLLSLDFSKHVRWEGLVLEDVDRTQRTAGLEGIQVSNTQIPSRSTLGLAIIIVSLLELLSAFFFGAAGVLVFIYLTLGVFSLVWIDLSMRDPARHFHYHSLVETNIAHSLPIMDAANGGVV